MTPKSQSTSIVRADGLASVLSSFSSSHGPSSGWSTFSNPVSGHGTSRDRFTHTTFSQGPLLGEGECNALYNSWICRKVVDYVADEIARTGWTVVMGQGSTAEEIPGIQKSFRELDAKFELGEGLKAARQYGGGAIIMYVNDGRNADEPIDWDNLRSVSGLQGIDRYHLVADIQPQTTRYDKPEKYMLNTAGSVSQYIHSDRVLRFDGRRLPIRERNLNQGWGVGEIQMIYQALARYEQSLGSVSQILEDLDVFVHKIKGLSSLIASGKEEQVKSRLAINDLSKSAYRGLAVDADKEDIDFQSRSCSGLGEILENIKENLLGATGFPATLLFGKSPQGIGATGRSEERDFARSIDAYRDSVVRKPLTQLAKVLLNCKEGPTKGKEPEHWDISFPSLFVLNERELADLKARVAASDYRYWLMGCLTSGEIAASRFSRPEYSTDTTLDMSLREPDFNLNEDQIKMTLRLQGKADPEDQHETDVDGPPGIRGLSKTGERSDPTDNENGSLEIDGKKSIAESDPEGSD